MSRTLASPGGTLPGTIDARRRWTLRINADCFNVLNNPNNPTGIGQDGLLATRNSGSAARTMQLTVRLIW